MYERAEFEAWAKQAGWSHSWGYSNTNKIGFCSASWNVWQAATQRQQERIAYVEKIAEDAIELCTQQANRVMELEAQVQALSLDAGRYRFLRDEAEQFDFPVPLVHITDRHGRVEIDEEGFAPFVSDMKLDKTIDDAIARATHKEGA